MNSQQMAALREIIRDNETCLQFLRYIKEFTISLSLHHWTFKSFLSLSTILNLECSAYCAHWTSNIDVLCTE